MIEDIFTDTRLLAQAAVGIINIVIGVAVLWKDHKNKNNIFASLTAFATALWILNRLTVQLVSSPELLLLFGRTLFITGSLISLFSILFAISFGDQHRKLSMLVKSAIYLPWAIFVSLALVPGLVLESIKFTNTDPEIVYGPGFPVFALFTIAYLGTMVGILGHKYVSSFGVTKIQLQYIFFGAVSSVLVGITANLILPFFGITQFVWMGPLGTIFLVAFIGYAITRHTLFDFRLVTAHLFTALVLTILLFEILLAETPNAILFKAGIFLIVGLFSYFIVAEAIKESQSSQRIESLTHNLTNINRRLQALDVEKSDFVSIASHQLRTPLTVIKGYASMLSESTFGNITNPKHSEIIDKILLSSERLITMIDDFLNIKKIEKGELTFNFTAMELGHITIDVIEEMSRNVEEENMTIAFEGNRQEKFEVLGDEIKIRQVLSNLIDNAVKYTPKGGKIVVRIKKDATEGLIRIEVSDNGSGIAPNVLPKLFQKFSRGRGMSMLRNEGTGLGLYVARQIMQAHRGKIWAESLGVDKGSTFIIEFLDASAPQSGQIKDTLAQFNEVYSPEITKRIDNV